MEKNGQRLLKLISNVLDFSKIEAGRMQVTKKPVDIGSLVTHCVSSVHSAAAGNGILLQTELSHERIVTLADPELMENALFNLISNAIKFNREGGRVTVRMKSTESILTISVEDTGIGIPEEYRERIFERFGQVDASSNRKYEGTGIGLALTKEIIEMHDGSISLESEENQGSVFTLQVPLLSPEESENLAPVVFEEELQREAVYEPEVVVGSNPGPLEREAIGTVLVVEDNEDMRNILAFLLEEKYRVIQATQGKEALALLEEHGTEIDLVLSDVTMPVMDGFELVDAVRENGQWRYLPIVLLTARADVQDTVHGITSGANDYIAKPFNREELMVRVDSHLKLKQLHDRVLEQKADLDRVSRERTVTDESREKIDLVLSFIRDNFREDLSREGLAAAVEMSPDHLSRTFKKHTGKRINEVINELRVQEAARLISGTDEKIITICHDVGFESLRTFNRVFSGIKGISPSEWRKNGEISQSHEGVEIISQDDLDDLKSIAETREEESIPHSELQK
jgi:DNA-binding response OmpR family regulator/anti-sigma regulatory factor (Ser/Thr protein kinase)